MDSDGLYLLLGGRAWLFGLYRGPKFLCWPLVTPIHSLFGRSKGAKALGQGKGKASQKKKVLLDA